MTRAQTLQQAVNLIDRRVQFSLVEGRVFCNTFPSRYAKNEAMIRRAAAANEYEIETQPKGLKIQVYLRPKA